MIVFFICLLAVGAYGLAFSSVLVPSPESGWGVLAVVSLAAASLILGNAIYRVVFGGFRRAVLKGDVDEAGRLLQRDRTLVGDETLFSVPPLVSAAVQGHVEMIRLLLDHGADVNAAEDSGLTPLHTAAQFGHVDAVELLLANGADIAAKDEHEDQPLHAAAADGQLGVAELLVARGAEVDAVGAFGRSPLDHAVEAGHREVAEFLRRHGGLSRRPDLR